MSNKNKAVRVRFSEEELQAVQREAERASMPVSTFLRVSILRQLKEAGDDRTRRGVSEYAEKT